MVFFQSARHAAQFYALNLPAPLGPAHTEKLLHLLQATSVEATTESSACFVTARLGTVSPWSSKATDILKQTGLLAQGSPWRIERIERIDVDNFSAGFDPLTQSRFGSLADCAQVFDAQTPAALQRIDVLALGQHALVAADAALGLALSAEELSWLQQHFEREGRNPSDAELVMFAQANSEHCRHKIFNAQYVVGGQPAEKSLFAQIRSTHACQPEGTVLAYADNAAILAQPNNASYHHVLKAETHNHPTAVSPFAGAATGAGGEIRDEGATGRGATPVAGLSAYAISHLDTTNPAPHLATPLQVLLQAPLGAAAFNNEFGRPNLGGALRVYEQHLGQGHWGFHKPIMLAAGWGLMDAQHAKKLPLQAGDLLVQLGGPGYLIGFGGGAASSKTLSSDNTVLDFASVQRDNAEMERRVQMVIDACIALGEHNPIVSIHDVGAGGLSNALPELVAADGLGARIDLGAIPLGSTGLSPMQVWSNESQERYVLAIRPTQREQLQALCQRERCPVAVLGVATAEQRFQVLDAHSADPLVVDWPMKALLGGLPPMQRNVGPYIPAVFASPALQARRQALPNADLASALMQVLAHPSVASKRYLVHIGDRTVGGRTHRDALVGPWQVPVADCAVSLNTTDSLEGAAAALGERAPVAVLNAPASGRLAVAESLLNLWAAPVLSLKHVKLSCNWMANAADPQEDSALRATVDQVTAFCAALDVAIPVGKDSLSMKAAWQANDVSGPSQAHEVQSPLVLMVTAFAPLSTVVSTLTPQLKRLPNTVLVWLKCNAFERMGGSIWQQMQGFEALPDASTPDVQAAQLRTMLKLIDAYKQQDDILAYHDVSDGGVWATLCEMAFAARAGLRVETGEHALHSLLCEEPSVVLQLESTAAERLLPEAQALGLWAKAIATPQWLNGEQVPRVQISQAGTVRFDSALTDLLQAWDSVALRICQQRDNPETAQQEHETACSMAPLLWQTTAPASIDGIQTASQQNQSSAAIVRRKPRAAVLREQGVNSHREMSHALHQAGFEVVDVHMNDLHSGAHRLDNFQFLAACGGFSFGDVLGAGAGWAKRIAFTCALAEQFAAFFANSNTLSLGVCNGCQMLSQLGELMPRRPTLPRFTQNISCRFEARVSMVEVMHSEAVLLKPLEGAVLPVVVSHGEGQAQFMLSALHPGSAALRFVMPDGAAAEHFPFNPNGSAGGLTGFSAVDGRILMMMPHPERSLRVAHMSWSSQTDLTGTTPWGRMFEAANRYFV